MRLNGIQLRNFKKKSKIAFPSFPLISITICNVIVKEDSIKNFNYISTQFNRF